MLHRFEHSRVTWQLDTLWWRTSPKLTSLGTNLDAILLAQIKLPHQRFGAFDSSPVILPRRTGDFLFRPSYYICSMLYDWFYCWLYLILVRLSVLLNIKYLKSTLRVSVNTPRTLSNNNPGFSLWGLTINSLTKIDEDISDIFWSAWVFLCLDQLLPDSYHRSGSLDLK